MEDFDTPWKEALEFFWPEFLAFFFPLIYNEIDWPRGYESLDKELESIVSQAELGKRLADKLFKVWRKNGEEAWVLIHVEIQAQPDANFPERMFVYHYRIFERYKRQVVSLAVLADERKSWRPTEYESKLWGSELTLRFPIAKLLDKDDLPTLEADANPFGLIVAAHLQSQATRKANESRFATKIRLVKLLLDRGMDADAVRHLFRFIDWLMALPEELEEHFDNEIYEYQKGKKMPYISTLERKAMERGREQGREQGREEGKEIGQRETYLNMIESGLQSNHPDSVVEIMDIVKQIVDVDKLQKIPQMIWTGESLDSIRQMLSAE